MIEGVSRAFSRFCEKPCVSRFDNVTLLKKEETVCHHGQHSKDVADRPTTHTMYCCCFSVSRALLAESPIQNLAVPLIQLFSKVSCIRGMMHNRDGAPNPIFFRSLFQRIVPALSLDGFSGPLFEQKVSALYFNEFFRYLFERTFPLSVCTEFPPR